DARAPGRARTRRQPAEGRRPAAQAVQERPVARRRHLLVTATPMRPEPSVILLTTLIGAGQGLFLAIFTAHGLALFDLVPAADSRGFDVTGRVNALALTGAGLPAACVYLGRPFSASRAVA